VSRWREGGVESWARRVLLLSGYVLFPSYYFLQPVAFLSKVDKWQRWKARRNEDSLLLFSLGGGSPKFERNFSFW